MLGLSLEEVTDLPPRELQKRLREAENQLCDAGAHYVVESFADLPKVIEDINTRLARGEAP